MMKEKDLEQLLNRAGSYTAKYEKSVKEVSDKLKIWSGDEITTDEIDQIIERLKEDHFIDEVRYADRFVRDKRISYHKGPMMIRQELLMKGISSAIIDDVLFSVTDEEWVETLEEYLIPRLEKNRKKARNGYELRMRMADLAYRRGFPRELYDPVLKRLLEGVKTDCEDENDGYWYD